MALSYTVGRRKIDQCVHSSSLPPPSPRGWWQFAAMNVLERVRERNRRCSPQFLLRRAEQNVAYVALYTQHLALVGVAIGGCGHWVGVVIGWV